MAGPGALTPVNFSELDRDVAGMILGRERAVMVSYNDCFDHVPYKHRVPHQIFLVPLKEVPKDCSLRQVLKWHKNEAVVTYVYNAEDHASENAADRVLEKLIMEMGMNPFDEYGKEWAVPAWNMRKYALTTDLAAFARLIPTRWVTVEHISVDEN